jgi:predicted RNA-binding protein
LRGQGIAGQHLVIEEVIGDGRDMRGGIELIDADDNHDFAQLFELAVERYKIPVRGKDGEMAYVGAFVGQGQSVGDYVYIGRVFVFIEIGNILYLYVVGSQIPPYVGYLVIAPYGTAGLGYVSKGFAETQGAYLHQLVADRAGLNLYAQGRALGDDVLYVDKQGATGGLVRIGIHEKYVSFLFSLIEGLFFRAKYGDF